MSLSTQPINCNNCGAPLDVAATTNFVTCGHCGTRLAVKRTESSVFTERLEAIEEHTETMTRQLAEIAYRAELERIDREWEQDRQRYLIKDKQGNTSEPTEAQSYIGGIFLIAFGLIWLTMTIGMGSMRRSEFPDAGGVFALFDLFPLVGLVMIGAGGWVMYHGPTQAAEFRQAKEKYRSRRSAVTVEQFLSPERPAARREDVTPP